MKRFCNHRNAIVNEALNGLVRSSYGAQLQKLSGADGIQVIVRKDWDKSRVAVISGGGSGHEPAHAGFVGEGMLTAAVCGALFASPSVDAILAAILAVTGDAGCIVLVKNYTGDRLNFGIAAEQARAMGYKVEVVMIHDDIALGQTKKARAIAGTVMVQKIVGHKAAQGASLEEVTKIAKEAVDSVKSLGLALTDCDVFEPGHHCRLGDNEIELGLGIHGEPGAERLPMAPLDELTKRVIAKLAPALEDKELVLMVNMLGAVPVIESQAIMDSVARNPFCSRVKWVIGPAPLMTALDMVGFSLTIMPAKAGFVEALQAKVAPPAWPVMVPFQSEIPTLKAPKLPETFKHASSHNEYLERLIKEGARILDENEQPLNALDEKIGDGDAGSTFAESGRQIFRALDKLPLNSPKELCETISNLLARYSGGSSGVLLSILFSAAGQNEDWKEGLLQGVKLMQHYGGASLGDRTMIDALVPALEALKQTGKLEDAAQAARAGAERTKLMKARAGRAAYVPEEQLRSIPDPGAEAIARLLEGLSKALS
ncbi:dihydroxyacetone kinase subunit DhaK [Aristophania vespae]|uniref:dihydroxyacetone kinase subunit DhaK n=1 Tax=Aristophania vespae TaxID=2697033 RepID=UPI0023512F95|nr:dihydroxyacetone kinase subunit DhaK [Aristophania vespae]UMM64524.1 Dihydroxyacetone kinase [Aristophania vespae]